jgi:hypothetical protein
MAGFESIRYIDPFAPLPIGASLVGVLVDVANPIQVGWEEVAYGRLLANGDPIAYNDGESLSTPTFVQVVNSQPLVPGVAYLIQVLFDRPGKDSSKLNWAEHKGVLTAPVVAHQGRIDAVQVTDTGLTANWQTASISSVPGALIEIVDLTGNELLEGSYLGTATTASLTASFAAGRFYGVRISLVQPADPGQAAGFAEPYTFGPPTVPQPIPTAAPTLSRLSCDPAGVAAQWTAPPVAPNAGPARYEILLLDGAKPIGAGPAGDTGGQLVPGELTALADPRLAGRASYGSLTGPIGSSAELFPRAPQIVSVTVTGSTSATITAELASPGALPAGGVLLATLYRDGVPGQTQTLASATGSVSWANLPVVAGVSHAIDVALQVSSGGAQSLGVRSPRLAVPLIAPTGLSAGYDGQQLSIDLAFPAGRPVDGYQVTLAGSGGGRQLVHTGPQLPISFAANLDLGQTWTAEVVPVLGIVSARPGSGPVGLPAVTAPVLARVDYDGAELSLQWAAAGLPYLSGYRVAVSDGPSLVVGGQQTGCVLPLAPGQAKGASVTVTGLSALRDTAASAAVPVLTSSIEVGSVTVAAEVAANWTVEPAAPAIRAVLMLGGSVVSTVPDAGPTGVRFAAPTPADQPYTLLAYPVSADGVATGPACAPVELILTAPSIESGLLNGAGQLSLRWNPGNAFGVTGYRLTATPIGGDPASLLVVGTGYDGPAPAAFSAPGTLAVTPVGARCTGPSATATIRSPVPISAADYADGQLAVTADLSSAGEGDTSWLEVLVNGAVLARQVLPGAARPPFTVPVALPVGGTAAVRISVNGPASLAPAGAPMTVPTRVPAVLGAAYDGSSLQVRWTPTQEAGVTGYLVSVAGTRAPASYVAGPDSASAAVPVELSYPFPSEVAVSVRAVAGPPGSGSSGQGQPSLGMPPTLAGYRYSVTVSQAGAPPYLYRGGAYQAQQSVQGQPIVLYLAKPFDGAANPTVPAAGSPVFQLAPQSGAGLPYQLTLSPDVWKMTGMAVRSDLRDKYNQFLTEVENLGVFAWAIGLLRQLIGQAMPQTFEEVLFYRYGYWRSDSLRVVDLMPGTRLQLSDALYQAVAGGSDPKNGFVAAGNQLLEVVDAIPQGGAGTLPAGAGRILSVDALLSLIYPGSTTKTYRPVAAGPVDFFFDNNRQSYYRLFYPTAFPASSSTGSSSLTSNITLVGTTSWATLNSVTATYAATGTFPSSPNYFAGYFRGRAGVSPLINLSIQGESRWVTLGTSVRQALASIGLAPFWGGGGGGLLSLRRASANLFGYPEPDGGLALDQVDLTGADLNGLTPLYWPLDMPLVGGDQLTVRQQPPAGGPA